MTDRHVSITGNDTTGDGSIGNPWRTIGKACGSGNYLNPGDNVLIHAGTYQERVYYQTRSGSAGFPITIRNYQNDAVILEAVRSGLGSWVVDSGSIYKVSYPTVSMIPDPTALPCSGVEAVVINDTPVLPKRTKEEMVAGSYYYDPIGKILYVQCSDNGDPNTKSIGTISSGGEQDLNPAPGRFIPEASIPRIIPTRR